MTLNNGVQMPALGIGVFQSPPEGTATAVTTVLRHGYGLIVAVAVAVAVAVSAFGPEGLDEGADAS
ncbi:hypothetical protein [Streptomyces pseudovenezuelae]|uniref:hypothetical protein n=1 Tax=Streptomyces pseudovenezuelae TaxID=67350 RepID=UPI0039A5FE78